MPTGRDDASFRGNFFGFGRKWRHAETDFDRNEFQSNELFTKLESWERNNAHLN
jgi:hypothetical protein